MSFTGCSAWRGSSSRSRSLVALVLIAIAAGRLSEPAAEGAVERARIRIAELARDLVDAARAEEQVPDRESPAHVAEELLERAAFLVELAGQTPAAHGEPVRHRVDADGASAQVLSDARAYASDERRLEA